MKTVLNELEERGFIRQATDREKLQQILGSEKISAYIGFDPTADSLHAGSLLPILALVHLQRWGHHPIVLVGRGTALVGDPSGQTELRQLLSPPQIRRNAKKIQHQLSRFLDFSAGRATVVDNYEWLRPLKYIDFLREIGRHFSVNRMLSAEAYKIRMERGLSFLEFNYQLLQAYDFLVLYRRRGCSLQMGGDDQWGNILAGVDLVRRLEAKEVYGLTFPLLTTATQQKMGKTAQGAVWLAPERTSPYDFFQYWRNVDDRDLERFLSLFTFLPLGEIQKVKDFSEPELNQAKIILAFEVTRFVHGAKAAESAQRAAARLFRPGEINPLVLPSSSITRCFTSSRNDQVPTTHLTLDRLREGIPAWQMIFETGLTSSKSEARRLIRQGGIYINEERVSETNAVLSSNQVKDGEIILRAGKKKYHRVVID